ncbi:MAG TPA: hypothetical protein VFT50_17165 [Baekduia sp.]|nr:hypothetical protein [Baekduia sp.]
MSSATAQRGRRPGLVAAVAVAGALLTPAASAYAKAQPAHGLYACRKPAGLNLAGGGAESRLLKLSGHGRYATASARKGRKLIAAEKGRWRLRGSTITWRSGTFKQDGFFGVWTRRDAEHPKGVIELFWKANRDQAILACTPLAKRR